MKMKIKGSNRYFEKYCDVWSLIDDENEMAWGCPKAVGDELDQFTVDCVGFVDYSFSCFSSVWLHGLFYGEQPKTREKEIINVADELRKELGIE